jgi:uncharacterized protein YggE
MTQSEGPDRFVEVTGEGQYRENVTEYVADFELMVRSARPESQGDGISEFRNACIAALLEAGLSPPQIVDGGLRLTRPWWKKPEKAGHYAEAQLTVHDPDGERLSRAIAAAEKTPRNERQTLTVQMRQPVFEPTPGAVDDALRAAVENAESKARVLALAANARLGSVTRISEIGRVVRRSGSYGDPDWWGDQGRFGPAAAVAGAGLAAGAAPDPEPPGSPTRTVWTRFAVRFALDT